jgi:O-antigen ligase
LYAFVFSVLFETVPLPVPLKLTSLLGGGLLLASLLEPRVCWRRPPLAFWCFAVWLYIAGAIAILHGTPHTGEVAYQTFVLAQFLTLFWIAYNLMRFEPVAVGVLTAIMLSCVVLALLQITGITSTAIAAHTNEERLSAMGQNPNALAASLSIGFLALAHLALFRKGTPPTGRIAAAAALVLVGAILIRTGSRTGILALGAGVLAFSFTAGSLTKRLKRAFIGIAGTAVIALLVYNTPFVRTRFEQTAHTGNMSDREVIYPAAREMVLEKPVLGWGMVDNTYEVQRRVRYPHLVRLDTHNLFLYVLTATGWVGALPFFLGLALFARAGWRARLGPRRELPLAFLASYLVANLATTQWDKLFWVVMAFVLSSPARGAQDPPPAAANLFARDPES